MFAYIFFFYVKWPTLSFFPLLLERLGSVPRVKLFLFFLNPFLSSHSPSREGFVRLPEGISFWDISEAIAWCNRELLAWWGWAKPPAWRILQDLHPHVEMSAKSAKLPNVPWCIWELTLFQDEFSAFGNYAFYLIPDQGNLFFFFHNSSRKWATNSCRDTFTKVLPICVFILCCNSCSLFMK